MKKILILILGLIIFTSCATQTSFHSFYKEHNKQSDLSIGSPSFLVNLFIQKEDLEGYEKLLEKVKHYKIMIFSEPSSKLDKQFDRFIKKKKFDRIFELKNKNERVQLYFLKRKEVISEIVLKIKDENSFVILGLKTKLKESELEQLLDTSVNITMND